MRAEPDQQRIVVQHLLEVRHQPLRVHAVAREAPADLIIDAAARHLLERVRHHGERLRVTGAGPVTQREVERHRRRKLGSAIESAVHGLVPLTQAGRRAREQAGAECAGGARALGACLVQLAHLRRRARDAVLSVAPRIRHAEHHAAKARHAVTVVGRVIGAREEWLPVRREKDRHRPSTMAGHGLCGLHVDGIDVGALLAIDLDAHEVFVHERRDGVVLERFALHDVAPVARRVADAQQDGLPLITRTREGGTAPGIPVDGIVRVLEEIGAGLVLKLVCHGRSCCVAAVVLSDRQTVRLSDRSLMLGLPDPPPRAPQTTVLAPAARSIRACRRCPARPCLRACASGSRSRRRHARPRE